MIFIIIGSQIASGIFALPRVVSKDAAQDAWIAVLIGALVPIASLLLIVWMARRFPNLSFVGLSQTLFGKIIGSGLVLIFVVYVIAYQSVVIRSFSEVTRAYLLPRTPMPVIILFLLSAVYYAASRGPQVVGRINELLFFFLLLSLFLLLPPTFKEANYTYLLPIATTDPIKILKGALAAQYAYGGMEVLLIYYFMVGKKNEVLKAGFIAVGTTAVIYVFMTVICLMVYSSEVVEAVLWPGLSLLKIAYFPVIERLEFIFLIFWLSLGVRPTVNSNCAAADCLTRLFKLEPNKNFPRMVGLITLGNFCLAILPKNYLQVSKLSDYATYSSFVIALGFPIIYLLMELIRGKKVG